MEPVTPRQTTTARHDLVVARQPRIDARVVIRSFDVDGPAAMIDRFIGVGLRLQADRNDDMPTPAAVVRHRLTSAFDWYASGMARHFVATIDGTDMGRCSATIDLAHRADDGTPVGSIGNWECASGVLGDAAAHALLEMAVGWLRDHHARQIVGPIDFATWHGYRFVAGNDDGRKALLTEPSSAPHSVTQWESFGFSRDHSYLSAQILDPRGLVEQARPVVQQLLADGWRIRQLRMKHWDELIELAHELSMQEFRRQPHFTPISLQGFRQLYEPARRSVDPRYIFTAWSPDGAFAGFVFGVRELGNSVRSLRRGGVLAPVRAGRAAWRTNTVLVKTICVAAQWRELGVSILLQSALYRSALDTGHTNICNMLMLDTNRSRALTDAVGAVTFREYVTLRLDVDRARASRPAAG